MLDLGSRATRCWTPDGFHRLGRSSSSLGDAVQQGSIANNGTLRMRSWASQQFRRSWDSDDPNSPHIPMNIELIEEYPAPYDKVNSFINTLIRM